MYYSDANQVNIIPFFNTEYFFNCNLKLQLNNFNYLYVADSSSQKNHMILLSAWNHFAKKYKEKKLTLNLTLPNSSSKEILDFIDKIQNDGVRIINHKDCNLEKIRELYKNCNYLIYPSLTESFGLPLIEAALSGCKVISSDLPYVYQVVSPSLVFDPTKEESIIDALSLSINFDNIKPTKIKIKSEIDNLINSIKYV